MIKYWIKTNTLAEPPASSAVVLTGRQMVTAALVETDAGGGRGRTHWASMCRYG
jgi:hypothetical protein